MAGTNSDSGSSSWSKSASDFRANFAANADRIRSEVFGFSAWRGEQAAVMDALAKGNDVLTVMPTGMGKSLCYQVPSRVFATESGGTAPNSDHRRVTAKLVLVVSPLIALMKDQVDAARSRGLKAAAIHSAMPREQRDKVLARVAARDIEILYATPERFRQDAFREALKAGGGVRLLAIDEAHCISTWGHDFRLDYSRLGDRRRELGNPQTLALTATATKDTQADIVRELRLGEGSIGGDDSIRGGTPEERETAVIVSSIWRPNLAIEVLETGGLDEKVRAFAMLRHMHEGPAILYFSLIQTLRKFSDEIERLGFAHSVYHGQLGDRPRRDNQEAFIGGSSDLMLATSAFGLGVDKANVRLLVHAEMPGSMEAYYQEIGRAGRDGERSACAMLYDPDDVTIQKDFVKWATPDPGFIQSVHNLISRNEMRARQEGFDYLRAQMNFYNKRDYRVETSVALLERWGALEGREPRDWKIVADIPDEFLDKAKFEANQRRREEKLSKLADYFESPAVEAPCRLASIARNFGENVADRKCGVCDACLTIS
jgi:ATP-dependent DNA helicase RecQ